MEAEPKRLSHHLNSLSKKVVSESGSKCSQCKVDVPPARYLCDSCRDHREIECRRIDRKEKVVQWRKRLGVHIPPLFSKAHIRDLNYNFLNSAFSRDEGQGLLLWGPPGVGKSHAIAAIIRNSIVMHHKRCKRISYDRLCLDVRSTYSDRDKSEEGIIRNLVSPDYLFVEDLGSTVSIGKQESDFSSRIFLMVLDGRVEQIKPTFITTNKSAENLSDSFGERIASRLQTFKVIEVSGKDKRTPEGKKGLK